MTVERPDHSQVMLSAIQPTNRITLGNYLGAIRNWVKLQAQYQCYFFAVDLHAITVRQDPKQLLEDTYTAIATYLASGINPDECVLFVQSHVAAHSQLAWVLNCFSYMGELNRMTQYKDKSSKSGKNIPVGLFTYPALMAADILLYDTNLVPVGADQKQHIELTRDIALRMNSVYGDDTFVTPEPFIAPSGARVMDLQNPTKKMSKSAENEKGSLFLMDSPKQMQKKIKSSVTDSGSEVTYDDNKPGVKNLIDLQVALTGRTASEVVADYQGKMYGHLKADTADIIVSELEPLQKKVLQYLDDRGELQRILTKGAGAAAEKAAETLKRVYDRIGFVGL